MLYEEYLKIIREYLSQEISQVITNFLKTPNITYIRN